MTLEMIIQAIREYSEVKSIDQAKDWYQKYNEGEFPKTELEFNREVISRVAYWLKVLKESRY